MVNGGSDQHWRDGERLGSPPDFELDGSRPVNTGEVPMSAGAPPPQWPPPRPQQRADGPTRQQLVAAEAQRREAEQQAVMMQAARSERAYRGEQQFDGTRRQQRRRRPIPLLTRLAFLLAGAAIAVLVMQQLRVPDEDTAAQVGSSEQTDATESEADEPDEVPTPTTGGADSGEAGAPAEEAPAPTDPASTVVEDPEWPGGTGPVPDGPPQTRRADITAEGRVVLTGSAPNWATVTKIVQFAGEKVPAGPEGVDNQLTWHPDASASTQWGDVGILNAARFDTGGTEIAEDSLVGLDVAAEILAAHPTVFAVVIGHADGTGEDDINSELAAGRAGAAVDYLIENGVVGGQIVVASASADDPMATNDTEAGRAENRRVEIKFKNFLIPDSLLGVG